MDFTNLKKAHDGLCITIENAKKEAEESKNLAISAFAGIVFRASALTLIVPTIRLSVMEPLIDSDATFRRAADTKAVLKELQDDLAACTHFSAHLFLTFMASIFASPTSDRSSPR